MTTLPGLLRAIRSCPTPPSLRGAQRRGNPTDYCYFLRTSTTPTWVQWLVIDTMLVEGVKCSFLPLTLLRNPAMSQNTVLDEIIPAGKPWSGIVEQGQYLSIVDLEGQQGVDFLCYNADNPEERYHAPNTLKAIETLKLTTGHTLYSDVARPLFTITHDSCNGHDTIAGCCSGDRSSSSVALRAASVGTSFSSSNRRTV